MSYYIAPDIASRRRAELRSDAGVQRLISFAILAIIAGLCTWDKRAVISCFLGL